MWRILPSVSSCSRIRAASTIAARRFLSTSPKPFEKVLIANRGEISQRVMRTCGALGIDTVAIYSTADAHAPFVKEADEAICIGPPASSESYLNSQKILDAISVTGAQAVHPGYGFMSENAEFSKEVTDMGVAWLGPSPHAVKDMGDKLTSKQLALQAGVNIIPGYDGPMKDVKHALEVANDIGYPILLKAQAGGGGKGMRVCRNDADVIEAFPMATEEGLKFFKDPRLLCEKYIDNPHHIEFQVLAGVTGKSSVDLATLTTPIPPEDLDILVFPERECSIQRRHQKVIEESPSTLLKEETRLKMVEQVKALVRQVGYTSAGTVEWLVDENQDFYFLEMNTRLQVEHPITEAVSGVDLVEGMLYVGAGMGIPSKYLEMLGDNEYMPHCGHAVEARIYAEDPLRGFLPSTGPLIPYQEPSHLDGIRVDSGVAEGHVVSPHYDPMLSKVISYADSRKDAVNGLAIAMDNYVIEGVQHNARLVNAVLRNDDFIAGNTPTSFLDTHYPDGFHGVELTLKQKERLAAIMAMVGKIRRETLKSPLVPGSTHEEIVRLGGMFGEAFCVELLDETTASVKQVMEAGELGEEEIVTLDGPLDYEPTNLLANAYISDKPITVQVLGEDVTGEIKVQMYGADMPVLLQSPREFELSKYMHEPVAVDTSSMVLSPMPGTLIKMTVGEGDHVETGQELCIVEAMKMQNIIRSPRAGTIGKCRASEGSSLRADEVIIEFAAEESSDVAA